MNVSDCMKRILVVVFAAVSVLTSRAGYGEGYYDAMDGTSKESLKAAAKKCVEDHQRLNYSNLPNYWIYSDVYPELYDGLQRWWDMYSANVYLIADGMTGKASFSANKMQREHAVPKSWWKSGNDVEYTPAYTDMWNLYPSDGPANQAKLNYPLGPVRTADFDNGVSRVGPAMSGFGGGSGKVFEPGDEYKGDFARAFFYMATVYDDLPWAYTYMFQTNEWPTLRSWAVSMLLDWARQDPVSQKEMDRNDAVEKCQGNRNPYIDFPHLAEYIWGDRMSDVFYLADQEDGGVVVPPIDGDPQLDLPVDGEALDFGEAAVNRSVSTVLRIKGRNLTAPLSIRVTGTDRDMFVPEVTSIPAAVINTREEYLLPIVFHPSSIGVKSANLVLYDGGLGGGNNVSVTLRGESLPVPVLTPLVAYEAADVSPEGYLASWSAAPEIVDYYVLNRVRYLEDGSEGELLESDATSIYVSGRDPEVMESYTVFSSRLGCLSEASNSIVVAADSGVLGIMADVPFEYEMVGNTLVVLGDVETGPFSVTDVYGRMLLVVEKAKGGDSFVIPAAGVVIVSSRGVSRKHFLRF